MRTLKYLALLCLSGIYLGLVRGYPPLEADDIENARAGRDHSFPPFLRLGRLVESYLDAVSLQRDSDSIPRPRDAIVDDILPSEDSTQNLLEMVKNNIPEEYQLENEYRNVPSYRQERNFNDEDIEDSRSKRQQGWYTQYGKRSSGFVPRDDEVYDRMLAKRQQGWHTQYGKRGSGFEPRDVDVYRPSVSKGQQGWHTQHGKRDSGFVPIGSDVYRPLISVGLQGWHTQHGKRGSGFEPRDDEVYEPMLSKRQQGWHTQYGKRGDSGFRSRPL